MTAEPTPTGTESPPPQVSALRAINQAANVVSFLAARSGPDTFKLRNGVVLKLAPVPPLAMREAAIHYPPPHPPVVLNRDKDREETNPNDPDYLEALERYTMEQAARVADVMILLGTSIESIPEGVEPPESPTWKAKLEALDIKVDSSNEYKQYLAWLRLYALTSEQDLAYTLWAVTRISGVTEEEVRRAASAFRDSA